jgi:EmrB/QacA subfamily drug resistance transporter
MPTQRTNQPLALALAVLLAGPFLAQADATIANVATPSIRADLGASGSALELVIGGYLIAFAVLLITGARLGHTYGYRRLFLIGLAMFTTASLACGLAPTPVVLIAARVTQGAGAAVMFPQTLTGIQLNYSGDERTRAIGLYAIALSTGAVVGQILGGLLISANIAGTHWRTIFLVNVPVGIGAIFLARRVLPRDARREQRQLDLLGVATLSLSVALIVVPLVLGRSVGWATWTWLSFAASGLTLVAFVAAERHLAGAERTPLVNFRVLRPRPVSLSMVTLFLTTGSYYAILFTLAQYLQRGLGRSALVSGLTLVPWVAAFGVAGQVVRRVPARRAACVPAAGCGLLVAVYAALSLTLSTGHHGEVILSVLLGFGGFGLGLQFSALIGHITRIVPADYAADVSGVTTTTTQIGGAVAVAAFGTLYLGLAHPGSSSASHAFALVTALLAATAAFGAAAATVATRG